MIYLVIIFLYSSTTGLVHTAGHIRHPYHEGQSNWNEAAITEEANTKEDKEQEKSLELLLDTAQIFLKKFTFISVKDKQNIFISCSLNQLLTWRCSEFIMTSIHRSTQI